MGGPSDDRTAKNADRQPGNAPPAPPRRHPKKYHGEIESPREQEKINLRFCDPPGAALDIGPNSARYSSDGDENKSGIHRLRNEAVERGKRGKAVGGRADVFLL